MNFTTKEIDRHNPHSQQMFQGGFTLVELLVALVITGIVISLTGTGLYALMNANQRSQIETTDRLELEQALAFMTDEIKMSQQVMTNIPADATDFNQASGATDIQIILVLKPAPSSKLTKPIIYYLADPPNSSVWLGPRVIYRWGPTLLQNGNYSDGDGIDVALILPGSPIEYFNEVLVDRISDRGTAPANIACESSYNYSIPAMTDRKGFYACIALAKKSVKIWMYKQPNSSAKSQSINALVVTRSN
ncbi:type II secretion system protein J [Chamaesiphon sp.]|uniref:type II secretion system protein J n=1 Tax=Chamaesiphon sp. TaxID=2814140 RepID=UPI0035937AC1